MVTINNSTTIQELRQAAAIQAGKDAIPTNLSNQVVPVIEVNPKLLRICTLARRGSTLSNATSATVYTTPADKDFYLVGATLSMIKDVTSQSTLVTLTATVDGTSAALLVIKGLSLTIGAQTISNNWNFPIKIDRNTNITITSDSGVANIGASGIVQGYIVDNVGA